MEKHDKDFLENRDKDVYLFNNIQGAAADTVRKLKLHFPRRHDCVYNTQEKLVRATHKYLLDSYSSIYFIKKLYNHLNKWKSNTVVIENYVLQRCLLSPN